MVLLMLLVVAVVAAGAPSVQAQEVAPAEVQWTDQAPADGPGAPADPRDYADLAGAGRRSCAD